MSERDRRRFPRTREPLEAQYHVDGDFSSVWTTMTVLNLSAGGLRYRGAEELDPGRTLQLKITLPGMPIGLELHGRIVWKQMHAAGVTEHGVEFHDLTEKQQEQIDQLVQFLNT